MVLAAGLGTRMRPLTDAHAEAAGQGRGQAADRSRARSAGRVGVEQAVVNVHYFAEQIEHHLARRTRAAIPISDERERAARHRRRRRRRRCRCLGDEPFFHVNSDTIWIDGVTPNLAGSPSVRSGRDGCPAAAGARRPTSIGYDARGDFAMAPDGRLTRAEREVVPFVYAGAAVLSPALFEDAPEAHSPQPSCSTVPTEGGRLYGLRLEGIWMHVGTPGGHGRGRGRDLGERG